jgi:hypothetical protein
MENPAVLPILRQTVNHAPPTLITELSGNWVWFSSSATKRETGRQIVDVKKT